MKQSLYRSVIAIVIFAFVLSSCTFPLFQKNPSSEPTVAFTRPPTLEALSPSATLQPVVEPTATVADTSTPEASPTTEVITHVVIPGDPTYLPDQVAVDCNTGARMQGGGAINISGCDYWARLWLERPTDSQKTTYQPALDILWSQTGKAEPWIFLRLKTYNLSTPPEGYVAGFELDADLDSRGEFLLLTSLPASTSWSTDGVQVWQDTNGSVGGAKPFAYDKNTGDGYETELVNSGHGKDADLAWSRRSPSEPDTIEFAVKTSLLPNPKLFGWWAWTGMGNLAPASFELVDSQQDAATWNLDNSCGWIYGTTPTEGQLANLCIVVKPTPTPVPPTAAPTVCPVTPCRLGSYWDAATCTCKRLIIILRPSATPTQIIIR